MSATLDLSPSPSNAPLPPFLLSIDVPGARIAVHGELDRGHVQRLDEAVDVLAHSSAPCWTVDASDMSFCDASGLRALVRAEQRANECGRAFVVLRPSACLRRLLQVVGVGSLPPA